MSRFKKIFACVLALLMLLMTGGCSGLSGNTYTITVENGTISGNKNADGLYSHNTQITLVADDDPHEKVRFASWTLDGVAKSLNRTYTFKATQSGHYVANYEADYDWIPEPGEYGFSSRTDLYRFYDDFSKGSEDDPAMLDDSKWGYDEGGGGFGNNEIQYYTRDNVRIVDDKCTITLKKEDRGNRNYTSGKFWSRNKFSSTYGKIEAKIRLFNKVLDAGYESEETQGLWPAFWMMPATSTYGGWPQSGEIDIMEAKGRLPAQMNSTIHRRAQAGSNGETWVRMATGKTPGVEYSTSANGGSADDYLYPNGSTAGDWHVYAVEWEYADNALTFRYYVDDILFFTIGQSQWKGFQGSTELVKPKPFDHDFYIIFNLALGGNFDGNKVPSGTNNTIPEDAPLFAEDAPPVEYEIDWVVWRDIMPRSGNPGEVQKPIYPEV